MIDRYSGRELQALVENTSELKTTGKASRDYYLLVNYLHFKMSVKRKCKILVSVSTVTPKNFYLCKSNHLKGNGTSGIQSQLIILRLKLPNSKQNAAHQKIKR